MPGTTLLERFKAEYEARGRHSQLARIVGQCHVADSYTKVLEEFISRLRNGRDTWNAMPAADRHYVVTGIVTEHAANHQLFADCRF